MAIPIKTTSRCRGKCFLRHPSRDARCIAFGAVQGGVSEFFTRNHNTHGHALALALPQSKCVTECGINQIYRMGKRYNPANSTVLHRYESSKFGSQPVIGFEKFTIFRCQR